MSATTRRCRATGHNVSVGRPDEFGLDDTEGPWVTVCHEHGYSCAHDTRALADSHAVWPEWCEPCQPALEAASAARLDTEVHQYLAAEAAKLAPAWRAADEATRTRLRTKLTGMADGPALLELLDGAA